MAKQYVVLAVALVALALLAGFKLPGTLTDLEPYYNWVCTYDATGKFTCTGTAATDFPATMGCSNAYDAVQQGWCGRLGINQIGGTVTAKTGVAVSSQQEDELYSSMTIVSGCKFGWMSGSWPDSNTRFSLSGSSKLTDIGCTGYSKGSATCPMVCDSYYNCNTNPSATNQVVYLFLSGRTTASTCKIEMQMTLTPIAATTTTIPGAVAPSPPSNLWQLLSSAIMDWLRSLFKWIFPGSIVGGGTFTPGQTALFQVSLSSPIDSNCNDGSCQYQYGSWAVIDSAGTLVSSSAWKPVSGTWTETVTTAVPAANGQYSFVAVLYNYNMRYVEVSTTGASGWVIESEGIAAKEAVEFSVGYGTPVVPTPPADLFSRILASIISFLKSLFWWVK